MALESGFLRGFLLFVGGMLFKGLMTTLRWRRIDEHKDAQTHRRFGPVIWAFWHSQMAIPGFIGRNRGIRILISTHRDGDMVAHIVKGLGYNLARGSSTRGGIRVLRKLARTSGREDLAITPDGPLGPPEHAQPGTILLAQLTGRPILPLGGAAYPAKRFNSWDRLILPLPFSRAALVFGDPIFVPPKLDAKAREQYRRRLQEQLNSLTRRAEHACME